MLNKSNNNFKPTLGILPEKVLQFGTGVLLRGLCDYLIDKANKNGVFNGSIVMVKTTGPDVSEFQMQDNLKEKELNINVENVFFGKSIIFWTGIIGLIAVPVFTSVTHLPPFIGMLLVLGIIWVIAELLLKNKDRQHRTKYSVYKAIEKIDIPSIMFFLGILLAVSALETVGVLSNAANWLTSTIQNQTLRVTLIGLLSSVVDNVPLVAATMGMYSLEQFPIDNPFWELLAFCAGTGGSALIIGSAAGIAAMGIEKIEFFWYVKKISWLALLGYFAGIGVFLLQSKVLS